MITLVLMVILLDNVSKLNVAKSKRIKYIKPINIKQIRFFVCIHVILDIIHKLQLCNVQNVVLIVLLVIIQLLLVLLVIQLIFSKIMIVLKLVNPNLRITSIGNVKAHALLDLL